MASTEHGGQRRRRRVEQEIAEHRSGKRRPPKERISFASRDGKQIRSALEKYWGTSSFMLDLRSCLDEIPGWRPTVDQGRIVLEVIGEDPVHCGSPPAPDRPVMQAGEAPVTKKQLATVDFLKLYQGHDPYLAELRRQALANDNWRPNQRVVATVEGAIAEERRLRKAGEL